jgi:ADP-ribose pyrophosphatase YjhB (NUDIX family)
MAEYNKNSITVMIYTCGTFLFSNDNKLLICHPTNAPKLGNVYSIPKGICGANESFLDATIREVAEETGLKLDTTDMLFIGYSKYRKNKKTLVAFLCKLKNNSYELNLKCSSKFKLLTIELPEIDEFKWIDFEEIDDFLHYSQLKFKEVIMKIKKQNKIDKID